MATTKPAAPAAKKSSSVGIKDAIWVIVICAIIAFLNFFLNFGQSSNFEGCDPHSVAHRYLHGYRARARSEQVYR